MLSSINGVVLWRELIAGLHWVTYGSRALSSGSAPHGASGGSGEQGSHDC